jgi:D-erythronate 2-dehydrogenase
VRCEPNESIAHMVAGWPKAPNAVRAKSLGFRAGEDISAIIQTYIEDDFKG